MERTPKSADRPFIIPVFLPHSGCPHQCSFCNQRAITSITRLNTSLKDLHAHIETFLNYKGPHRNTTQIAFYGGNFLGMDRDTVRSLLHMATGFVTAGKVDTVRFSTRPDTINSDMLAMLNDFPVSTIELGVQSMDDRVLLDINRGHTARDTEIAAGLLKTHHYEVGLQMMVGLPGDDGSQSIETARRMAALSPDFVRIYPTIVLAGSPLAERFKTGTYQPLSLDTCVTLVKQLYQLFQKNHIPVIRMGLQASEDLDRGSKILAGPYHPAFGHLVFSEIFLDMATSILKPEVPLPDLVTIRVHPDSISKMRGLKNANVSRLKQAFKIKSLEIKPDASLGNDNIKLDFSFECR
jgi:histone acetyltransferase (RNA polymerase elongator complex component)